VLVANNGVGDGRTNSGGSVGKGTRVGNGKGVGGTVASNAGCNCGRGVEKIGKGEMGVGIGRNVGAGRFVGNGAAATDATVGNGRGVGAGGLVGKGVVRARGTKGSGGCACR
jgi:hypothetical protein